MQRPTRLLLFATLLAAALPAPVSAEGRRVALVIANSRYQQISSLKNPLADGKALAERLRKAGFDLLRPVRADSDVQTDLSLDEMLKADEALEQAAAGAEMVLLFYTGHGLQMEGVPYLVPVELPSIHAESLRSEVGRKLLKRRLMELDDLVAGLDQHAQVAVAMFDACREIPQLEESSKAVFGGESPFRGLARAKSLGRHRLLAYSASSGELAKDGLGQPHSPYIQAWLDEFDKNAGQKDIIAFFSDVAVQVPDAKGQNPELVISGIRSGTYYFNPAGQPATSELRETPNAAKPSPPVASDEDQAEKLYLDKNYRQALPLYRKLAEAGNGFAQFRLGSFYENGLGVPIDVHEAATWYERAAQTGDAFGQYSYGRAYRNGNGWRGKIDEAQAQQWEDRGKSNGLLEKAESLARRGDPVAQFTAGRIFHLEKRYPQALEWYRQAAKQGLASAQLNLGAIYYRGDGMAKDPAQAAVWYRKAAEQGYAAAQTNLGGCTPTARAWRKTRRRRWPGIARPSSKGMQMPNTTWG